MEDQSNSQAAKQRQRCPRSTQFCAVADSFPTEPILNYLRNMLCLCEVRFCSVFDADGKLPPKQSIKSEAQWQGGVQMFFRRQTMSEDSARRTGLSIKTWENILDSVMFKAVSISVRRGQMKWDAFLETLSKQDQRIDEIRENIILFKEKPVTSAGYMSPTCAAGAARAQQEAVSTATALAAEVCCEAEEAAAAAVEAPLTQEDREAIRKASLRATLDYVAKKCEQETGECLPGQPARKRRSRGGDGSKKSKKPEHVERRNPGEEGGEIKSVKRRNPGEESGEIKSVKRRKPQRDKRVSFSEDSKGADERAPDLTLAQRVVHRSLPQPEGSQWKYAVAHFLQSSDVYDVGRKKGIRVLRGLLPQDAATVAFFQVRNRQGLGALLPAPERADHAIYPSTLELHRVALRLEGAAESLLSSCATAITPAAAEEMPQELAAALQAAWIRRGGVLGSGPEYWPAELDAGLFSLRRVQPCARFAAEIDALRASRRAAFAREYLVVDEVTWCLPYISKVYFLRCKATSATHTQVRVLLEGLTHFRRCAMQADAAPLASYARGLHAYAERLARVGACLGVHCDEQRAVIEESGSAIAAFQVRDDPAAVRCRVREEAKEARALLQDLGMQSSPAIQAAERLRDAVMRVMQADSHKTQGTGGLNPSPALPAAVYDPARYL